MFRQSQSVSNHPPKLSRSYLGNSSAAARWANKKTIAKQVVFADAVEKAQGAGGSLAHITGTASEVAEQACRITGVLTLWREINAVEVQMPEIESAVALAKFYLFEASCLASAAVVSAEIDNAERSRQWLL